MEVTDYLRGILRHWLAILLMTLVGLGAAFGWVLLQTPVYEATSVGLVQSRSSAAADDENGQLLQPAFDSIARGKVPTYLDMATWRVVADGAIAELGLATTPEAVVQRITIENPNETSIIRVTAQGETPAEAAALSEAWLTSLASTIDAVEGEEGAEGSSPVTIFVTSAAALPQRPIFPDIQTAMIVGAVLGLGLGIAFALMRTVSDRRIRAAEDVESHTSLPVVGAIPSAPGVSERTIFDTATGGDRGAKFAVSESLRALRTNLQFMDVDNPPRTIVVTSPLPGDGKSTIACNLAHTLATNGQPVVIVDGDLRRPKVAETIGVPGGAGLSDVLSGRADLSDVLQRAPGVEHLFVLTAGSTPPNPSEVLGSDRMRKLLADLAGHATVIIDAPPLLPVTDGAVLTHQSDGALMVITAGKTTYDLLDKALGTLTKAGGRALGVVLNKTPLRGPNSSAYSYEYRREYGPAEEQVAPKKRSTASADLDDIFADTDAESAPPAAASPPTPARTVRERARQG